MGKDKIKKFNENLTFRCMVQPEFEDIFHKDHALKGRWHKEFFGNDNPIILELGCGRGEYTVGLARRFPEKNIIGIDIKGARMWRGAKTVNDQSIGNAGFLRTRIEFINSFFAQDEIAEIWITFPDPQLKKRRAPKRLTSPEFLARYSQMLAPEAVIHLKTDSLHLHEYTKALLEANGIVPQAVDADIYQKELAGDDVLRIKTTYEQRFLEEGLPITYLRWSIGTRTEFAAPEFAPDEGEDTLDDHRQRKTI